MQLVDRRDAALASSLVIGTVVLFNRPLRALLETTASIESRYDVDLLPALAVMGITFAFHQYRKYREAAEETARADVRAAEIERLFTMGQSLAGAHEYEALRQCLHRSLPIFCGSRGYWLFYRSGGRWCQLLYDATCADPSPLETTDDVAVKAAQCPRPTGQQGVLVDGHVCYSLYVGDTLVGVLGVRDVPELTTGERHALSAAANIIALALRTVDAIHESQQKGVLDGLTGCLNRGAGIARLQTELRRAHRTGRPLSVLVLDLDNFKAINDAEGHLGGDRVLERMGERLGSLLRVTDVRCRMGGDEFLVMLPDTPATGAVLVAEKLRVGLMSPAPESSGVPAVTVSIGTATAADGELDALSVIATADRALYRAKRSGRNRWASLPGDQPGTWPSDGLASTSSVAIPCN